jgi:small subunit ribosomal protein S17
MMIENRDRGFGRTLKGLVTSDKMEKTITVTVTDLVRHPDYKKFMKRTTKYHAHDERNECAIGDTVIIRESRAYSKTKKWRVAKIVKTHQE